jgi:hypothetical protein
VTEIWVFIINNIKCILFPLDVVEKKNFLKKKLKWKVDKDLF